MIRRANIAALLVAVLTACGPGAAGGPSMNNSLAGGNEPASSQSAVVSTAILSREPVANTAEVKHILIGWAQLESNYSGGGMDPRAMKRTKADAEAKITELLGQLKAGGDFEALMKENSEDTGSAQSGRPMTVTPDAQLVIEFKQLSLRLNVAEYGVCQSDYGFHIIKRYQ